MFSLVMLILMYFFEIDKIETGAFNPTGLRTLRVLRPLRTINHLPGLKVSVLLFIVTFHANLAHSLTRSP